MAYRSALAFLCVALCCASAFGARELKQTGVFGPAAVDALLAPNAELFTAVPAPAPGLEAGLAPEIAPIASDAVEAPASAPVGGPGSCYVDWSANVQENSPGSSVSYSGPACVVVDPGLSASDCQAQATASGKTYVPTADPACLYPVGQQCSALLSSYPSLTACPQQTTTSIVAAAQKGTFNAAVAKNQASAPSLFSPDIFGSGGFGTGSSLFPSFPSFPGFTG